ncbi:hypothetical protein C2G38_2046492 [Gigaspora rosea]|uniref:C17orf113 probable zinc finger domain-containing protein n=1 Tax=Gigaspora rosea TaxID=44941 RepID=A0A397UCG9_9GLOM|nr:hypothetical protein C2G38_2046492 [Gigaspora rosea]CAG8661700.1 20313_t:CDS:1 [Gigaspora rosea]
MKRYFSIETNSSEKDTSKKDEQNQVEPFIEILSSEKPKRNKVRTSPDPKWMDNGNDAWLEYRNVNGMIFMFCKWCESKNYTNELAKGTSNYRKQSIGRYLVHHEHKAEVAAKKNQNISVIKFSLQLATDAQKLKTISQMQCIYFAAKKYLALAIYPDLYQFVNFQQKNSEVLKLCDTPEALELPTHLSKIYH